MPRGPLRRTLLCLLPIAIVGAIAWGGYTVYLHLIQNFGSPTCKLTANGYDYQWDSEQSANAATIVDVGVLKGNLPKRAGIVASMTALQESKLRNLSYGDLDSLGLFQQRPSQGWGTTAQIQDPVYATQTFYTALQKVGGWQTMNLGTAAQAVQKSDFPDAYNQHRNQGQVITAVMSGQTHEAIECRLDPATTSSTPTALVDKIAQQIGLRATAYQTSVNYDAASAQIAWALASWAVAHASADGIQTVTVGNRAWERRHRGRDGWSWHDTKQPTSGPIAVRIDLAH